MSKNSTTRFSDRVENYVKYRPSYPPEVVEYLKSHWWMEHSWRIADVGYGTGLFTKLLLEIGYQVCGVEPNKEMREAGEQYLKGYRNFTSFEGTAENTGLADRSVDLIIAAQAFHWFKPEETKREFRRILNSRSIVCFVWNDRETESSDFLREYEDLLKKFGTDYLQVNHRHLSGEGNDEIKIFFERDFHQAKFKNSQNFDWQGLKGRLLSSSYAPNEGHPRFAEMIDELRNLYERHQRNSQVKIDYTTQVFSGRLAV